MPLTTKLTLPPAASLATKLAAGVEAGEQAMADEILLASQPGVPVEFGALLASGRTVRTDRGVAITYGRDDDAEEGGSPTNGYVIIQHESMELHHPNGGGPHWLVNAQHRGRKAALTAAAVAVREALR